MDAADAKKLQGLLGRENEKNGQTCATAIRGDLENNSFTRDICCYLLACLS